MIFVFLYKLTIDEQNHQNNKLIYRIYLLKGHEYNQLNTLQLHVQINILIKINFNLNQYIIQNV